MIRFGDFGFFTTSFQESIVFLNGFSVATCGSDKSPIALGEEGDGERCERFCSGVGIWRLPAPEIGENNMEVVNDQMTEVQRI